MHLKADTKEIEGYLNSINFQNKNSWVVEHVEVPGDGNMNFTLRFTTNEGQSYIIKQSRPYVEKYPQVAAPNDRVLRESEFYAQVADEEILSSMTPTIHYVDDSQYILIMEDFGKSTDFTHHYKSRSEFPSDKLERIISFAASLHTSITSSTDPKPIENRAMRALNHMHMFVYPFQYENGLDLNEITPGLADLAVRVIEDKALQSKIAEHGESYLQDGESLLHGDYFLGSWLDAPTGIKVIDPEFCYYGKPEFEIGVMIGHMYLAQQPEATIQHILTNYTGLAPLDVDKTIEGAGIEMLRRILGLAQLPLPSDIELKESLLHKAITLIKHS